MTPGLFTLICPCGGELEAHSGDDDHVCSTCGANFRIMFGCLVRTESATSAADRPLVSSS
jgi:hypothetical protein